MELLRSWKNKVIALSMAAAAGSVALTSCDQQFAVHPDLGRVHFNGTNAELQECFSTKPNGGGDVFVLDFYFPVRLEQKSPDSPTGTFGDTSKVLKGSDFDNFIHDINSGKDGSYYTVDGIYTNTQNSREVDCTEDLGSEMPVSLDGRIVQARRSPQNYSILNGLNGPIDSSTKVGPNGEQFITDDKLTTQLAVPITH